MTEIKEDNSPTENEVKGFEINKAIEDSTVVESSEKPYYVGMCSMNLETVAENDETEEADVQKTENHGDMEGTNVEETNVITEIEAAAILQNTETPCYANLDDIKLDDNNIDEKAIIVQKTETPECVKLDDVDTVGNATKE